MSRSTAAPPVRRVRAPVLLAAAAVAAAVVVDPDTTHVPLCPFHAVTGWYCPLCGSLRAVHALSRGRWLIALQDNVLIVVALVLVPAVAVAARLTGDVTRRQRVFGAGVLVALALGYTIVRNLGVGTVLRPAG